MVIAARRLPRHEGVVTLADRLYAVQERVYRGRTGLDPAREAVATRAPVVGPHVDRLGRAGFQDVYVDAPARQRASLEHGADRRPGLSPRGAHLPQAHQMPRRCVHSAAIWMRLGGDHTGDLVKCRVLEHASPWCHNPGGRHRAVPSQPCVTYAWSRARVRLPAQGLKAMTRSAQRWPAHARGELKSRSHYAAALVGNRCAAAPERSASGRHPEQSRPVGVSDPRSAYLTRSRD